MIIGFIARVVTQIPVVGETLMESYNREVKPAVVDLVARWNQLAKDNLFASDQEQSGAEMTVSFGDFTRVRLELSQSVTSVVLVPPTIDLAEGIAADLMLIINTNGMSVSGWPANVSWTAGAAPSLPFAPVTAIIDFVYDGTSYIGSIR